MGAASAMAAIAIGGDAESCGPILLKIVGTSRSRNFPSRPLNPLPVLGGHTYLAVAVALRSIPPLMLMATRSIAGGLILLACVKLAGRPTGSPRTWAFAAACGVLFFVGCHGVLAHAQQQVPSGLAAVLLATIPFWILIAETLLPGSKPGLKNLAVLTPGIDASP